MVGIVIPTMNRPDFLLRQLNYYAGIEGRHTIYVGDSSDSSHYDQVSAVVRRINSRVKVVHLRLPGLNDTQAITELLQFVEEPYAAFVGDDDFLVPQTLGKCAQFLKLHPEFGTAHGVFTLCNLESSGAYGNMVLSRYYKQEALEQDSARRRLTDYLGNYWVTLFSVHRTQSFLMEMDVAKNIPCKSFRELLPCCLAVVRGKSKQLNFLHAVRQAHEQRYLLPDPFDWVTSVDWSPSYSAFRDCLAEEVARQDRIGLEESREVVSKAFLAYLVNGLVDVWGHRYVNSGPSLRSRSVAAARWVPGLRRGRNTLRSFLREKRDKLSLQAMLHPNSPYHEDFMPIYREITAPLADSVHIAKTPGMDPPVGTPSRS